MRKSLHSSPCSSLTCSTACRSFGVDGRRALMMTSSFSGSPFFTLSMASFFLISVLQNDWNVFVAFIDIVAIVERLLPIVVGQIAFNCRLNCLYFARGSECMLLRHHNVTNCNDIVCRFNCKHTVQSSNLVAYLIFIFVVTAVYFVTAIFRNKLKR